MRSIRIPLALLLAGTIVGCGLTLGLDDYQPACEASNCIQCTDPAACGVSDPCAPWTCETGYCKKAPVPARTPCAPGVCDGEGRCVDCVAIEDCPFWEFCGTWACENKTCVLHPDPAGTIPPQIEGDCKATQCDGSGQILNNIDDTDVPPTTDCQIGTCLNGKPNLQPVPQSTLCNEDDGKVCNGKGECVECTMHSQCGKYPNFCDVPTGKCFNCFDGVQNGDETDVDCGGDHCQKCSQSKTCKDSTDCLPILLCVDGVCCSSDCNEVCWACNTNQHVGECMPLPKYSDDVSPDGSQSCLNVNGHACNLGGVCEVALGAPCTGNGDCASHKCRDNNNDGQMECVKDAGDPCKNAAECYSFICSNGLCAP